MICRLSTALPDRNSARQLQSFKGITRFRRPENRTPQLERLSTCHEPLDMRPETINPCSKESRYMSLRWILCLALTPLVGLPASAQSVISAHSGLIHFSEGSVYLDDQRVEQKTGKFGQMNNGSELRTEEGRAEVLLTPGTF